jgi:anti-anti-sigma factor
VAVIELSWTADPRRRWWERVQPEGARAVVSLRGEHDVSTAAPLWHIMALAIRTADSDLLVDLSEVEFMAAATVGVIVEAAELLRQRSRSLLVRAPSRRALRVLDLCGLTHLCRRNTHRRRQRIDQSFSSH